MVEQRYRAVLEVQAGVPVTEVADRFGVSRQAVHRWLRRYTDEGLDGLTDRSHRPQAHPDQTSAEVESAICELRRTHPRWGQRRLHYELGRRGCPGPVPSLSTIYRVLVRHGLIDPTPRRRRREDYQRWERNRPMELWQMDIVGGVRLADGTEAKVVTGVDDHSRFCVIAAVVPRATGRAVCLALVAALREYGVPEELLTDNGKQFTARFNAGGGEVMFDRICRENGITHRLTKPRSPTTTGKVERFHQTLQRELLDDHPPFASIADAQAAIDRFRHTYNVDRPHQSLGMDFPADRFTTGSTEEEAPLRLPPSLTSTDDTTTARHTEAVTSPPVRPPAHRVDPAAVAVEVTRTVPASGNLAVCGQQFWLGPTNAGRTITLWADTTVIHLLLNGARLKTVPSRLTLDHLRQLLTDGGRPAGPPPTPTAQPQRVDRRVSSRGSLVIAGQKIHVGITHAGRTATVEAADTTFRVYDGEQLLTEVARTTTKPIARFKARKPEAPRRAPR